MSKSRLSHKLVLCDLINQLDDKACITVIRSIHNELGCDNLNMLLSKIILHCTLNTTTDSLIKMENVIKDIVANMNTSADNDKNINGNKKPKKMQNNSSTLLRLPIDIISKTSLYLNENDVFPFEQSCRSFYQIVNNSSYVNQSNTFKTFYFTKKELVDKMAQPQYNFYKYSKATKLIVWDFSSSYQSIQEFESHFEQAKIVANYDKWFTTMLKTIKLFEIKRCKANINNCASSHDQFFSQLPLDIMFDSSKSNLETIRFDSAATYSCTRNMVQFTQEYMNVKKKFEAEGKKIKVLNRLQQYNIGLFPSDLFCIESKHIWVLSSIDWKSWDNVRDSNSSLTTITFQGDRSFRGMEDNDIDTMKKKEYLHIETLRILNLFYTYHNPNEITLLRNEKVIEILNLHHSVKNITVGIIFYALAHRGDFKTILSNLLMKKYYFNLVNVNIVLCVYQNSLSSVKTVIDWMFGILMENKNVLKYQFKQLRIGIQSQGFNRNPSLERCYVFELNKDDKINDIDKFLNDYKAKCDVSLEQSKLEYQSSCKKCQEMKQQWLD